MDAIFCCLPHATTQEVIKKLPSHLKIVDLSADFRLRSTASYAEWYGHEHAAPELQKEAVYGTPPALLALVASGPRSRRPPRSAQASPSSFATRSRKGDSLQTRAATLLAHSCLSIPL